MASLASGLLSGIGTVAKGVGTVGKGFLGGAGEATGLGNIFKPAPTEFAKNVTARGTASLYNLPGQSSKPSLWQRIGKEIGGRAILADTTVKSNSSLPSVDTSTRVSQSRGYQPKGKKSQMETLLEQLARR